MPTRNVNQLTERHLSDPAAAEAYEALSPYEDIARQLIAFRIKNGLTQSDLARLAGMHQSAIARLESGEHEPTLRTLQRVTHALGGALLLQVDRGPRRREILARL